MRALFIICLFAVAANTFAWESVHRVLVRKKGSNDVEYIQAKLEDLSSKDSFDGAFFKVVLGKSNEAIKFNHPDKQLLLKAATTYYHATIARDYFIKTVKSAYVAKLPKVTIRLEITNTFNKRTHYNSDAQEKEYNNALSVPPGSTPEYVKNKDSWGHEIWFRPKKVIKTSDLENEIGENPFEQNMRLANDIAEDFVANSIQFDTLNFIFHPEYQEGPFWMTLVRHAGTLIVTRGIYELSKKTDSWFLQDKYYLDTALVPEIIYHEYSHIALSDFMEVYHSTPMVEGMADFFATAINPQKHMFAPINDVSNNAGKLTQNDKGYQPWYEDLTKSRADFVLSVLWQSHKSLTGGAIDLIYDARKSMNTEMTSIGDGLPRSLLKSCRLREGKTSLCRREVLENIRIKGF